MLQVRKKRLHSPNMPLQQVTGKLREGTGKIREDGGKLRVKVGDRRILPSGRHLTADDAFEVTLDYVLAILHNNDAVYMNVTVLGLQMLGFLDSGASHVFVNTTSCDKLLTLGLILKKTPVNSCSLANDTLVECLGAISVPFRVHDKICLIDALGLPSVKFELVLRREFWRKFGLIPNFKNLRYSITDDAERNRSPRACDLNNFHGVDDLRPRQRAELERIVSD
jgi:hypothetical protein